MPLVPCLYLLWFSYNQMENLKKQIRYACPKMWYLTVLKRQAVKLLVSAMIWLGRGLKPGLLCTSFRKSCSWAHNCCSASRPRRPANRKVQDEIGPRRNVPVPRLWDAKSPNEWLEASFDSQRTTSTTAYGGSTTTASRYNCYLNFIHFSQAKNPHHLGSGRLKGFFI